MTIEDAILDYYEQRNEGRKAEFRQIRTHLCGCRLDDVAAWLQDRIADQITHAELSAGDVPPRKIAEMRAAKVAAEKLLGRLHRISL